jgi:hypothetical protein
MYGDESADEKRVRVFAVGGVVGSEEDWCAAERLWSERTAGKPFHGNVIESEYVNDPDPQKHTDNLALYKDLTQLLAGGELVGFAVALDLISFRELFPDVLQDVAYYKCFSDLIAAGAKTAASFNALPHENVDVRLEFTFDSRIESNGTAGALYNTLRNEPEWADAGILATNVAFEGGPNPRLEMGDLLAREAMKELDRRLTNARPTPRRSWEALENARCDHIKKFHFINHDRAYCERWRASVDGLPARELMGSYRRWLADTKRNQDTMTDRAVFLARVQKEETGPRKA